MSKRSASAKATRGVNKAKKPPSSGSSNPKTNKFRSQYNNLAVIAKGGPTKKAQNKESMKKLAQEAVARKKLLDGLNSINMLGVEANESDGKQKKSKDNDLVSNKTGGTRITTASFASVWSDCTNASLNEFFQVWNPNLETHKDALSVIAGLSEIMSSKDTEQSDLEYSKKLFKIISAPESPENVITGALLALTFVMRKLPADIINLNFDMFYAALKDLLEKYHTSKKKTLMKSLIRCFACLTKAHPLGKEVLEKSIRKKINLAIRQYKVQNKVSL